MENLLKEINFLANSKGVDAFIRGKLQELHRAVRKLEKAPEGDGEPCYYCGSPCDGFAGDPGLWPIGFSQMDGTGICRWHHARCVVERLPPPTAHGT